MFSAWVLWSKEHPTNNSSTKFDWRTAAWSLRVPMIKALFEQIATTRLETMDLVEPMDWADWVLNRVERDNFFIIFDEGKTVQYSMNHF